MFYVFPGFYFSDRKRIYLIPTTLFVNIKAGRQRHIKDHVKHLLDFFYAKWINGKTPFIIFAKKVPQQIKGVHKYTSGINFKSPNENFNWTKKALSTPYKSHKQNAYHEKTQNSATQRTQSSGVKLKKIMLLTSKLKVFGKQR